MTGSKSDKYSFDSVIYMQDLFYQLSLFIDRFLTPSEKTLHTARFARLHEATNLSTTELDHTGLLLGLGRFGRVFQVRSIPTRRELGNVLVVAPTRGGKGLLAVSQLLTWPHSVIVNDIKGDLFTQTAGFRKTLGEVYVIDPTGIGHRYDPLLNKTGESQLLSAATNLLHKADEGDGAIFTQRAIVMLTQIFLAARLMKVSLLTFVREVVRLGLYGAATRLQVLDPALATQFLDVAYTRADFGDKFLVSCWGTLSVRMRLLLTEESVRCFSGVDFTAGDVMRAKRPVTVYLRWPERDLLALSPLVRLVWKSFIDELTYTYDSCAGQNCRPVLLLVDEAGRTAIPTLSEASTTINGRGISLWIAIQSLSQLDAVYGRAHARILRDNMDSQVYYRPCDLETAEYLQKYLGYQSGFASSETTHDGTVSSNGRSEREIPLLTAQAIKQLDDEDVIIFHRNLVPVKARRMDWRRFEQLQERTKLPAPAVCPSVKPGKAIIQTQVSIMSRREVKLLA
jgi:type IV secretion system protein VirD4